MVRAGLKIRCQERTDLMNKRIRINGKLYESVNEDDDLSSSAYEVMSWLYHIVDTWKYNVRGHEVLYVDKKIRNKLNKIFDEIDDINHELDDKYYHGQFLK